MLAKVPPQADFDTGPRNLGAGAERLCVVTRQVKPLDEMMRTPGVCGPKVDTPPGADEQVEFLAFMGRRV